MALSAGGTALAECSGFKKIGPLLYQVKYKKYQRPRWPNLAMFDKVRPHPETPRFPNEYSTDGPPRGRVYDKKPFKVSLEADKKYAWCSCGHSKSQPFCDGSHKKLHGTSFVKKGPKYQPIRFTVEETKEYWLCNCKQSANRPYCDGTHRSEHIQDAIKT